MPSTTPLRPPSCRSRRAPGPRQNLLPTQSNRCWTLSRRPTRRRPHSRWPSLQESTQAGCGRSDTVPPPAPTSAALRPDRLLADPYYLTQRWPEFKWYNARTFCYMVDPMTPRGSKVSLNSPSCRRAIRARDTGKRCAWQACLWSPILALSAVLPAFADTPGWGNVTLERLSAADREPGQWMAAGRTAGGTFYSPLKQIDTRTVSNMGFAWQYKTGTFRGMEGTPLV